MLDGMKLDKRQVKSFHKTIFDFYRDHGRHNLPWRKKTTPYAVVVSEIMLQQTQVDRVIPFFNNWMKQFPNWKKLASVSQKDLLKHWKGLGYNSRALRLQKLAQTIIEEYKGKLPSTREQLINLPGIGPYTAGAIRAFAFDESDIFIETNIRRIFIHHFFHDKKEIHDRDILSVLTQVVNLIPKTYHLEPRHWYAALMDYGSYLAKTIPNPNKKSKHYTKQSVFKGSDREIRGKILEILLQQEKISFTALIKRLKENKDRVQKICNDLEKAGFVISKGKSITFKN